jgi:uncharacterized protein YdeI (YjbR/CyaY-like superfamily)
LTAKKRSRSGPGSLPDPLRFFASADAFRKWLERNHDSASELWLGFHLKRSRRRGVDYDAAVEVALCFGWIDGLRKKLEETTYANRFTPRKPGSNWSRINIARVERLLAAGLMHDAGKAAYEMRDEAKSGVYSFEQRPERLPAALEARFQAAAAAWAHFSEQPPGYRRLGTWWVISAKREETQLRRLQQLIDAHAHRMRIGVLFGQTGNVASPGSKKRGAKRADTRLVASNPRTRARAKASASAKASADKTAGKQDPRSRPPDPRPRTQDR